MRIVVMILAFFIPYSIGVGIAFGVYLPQSDGLVEEQNNKIIEYMEQRNYRFEGDNLMSFGERFEVIEKTHKLTADDYGRINLIKEEYEPELQDITRSSAIFLIGGIAVGLVAFILVLKIG